MRRSISLNSLIFLCLGLFLTLAVAAIVNSAQVAAAVQSSAFASDWMKQNASAIGNLALKVENTKGDTTIYNGSCCYGILQVNTANIRSAGFTPEQFQRMSLQQQVDVWSKVQASALKHPNVKKLAAMDSFDGQKVDAAMVLSCVQLGQGNCGKMLRSGRCEGWRDPLGTSICKMANKLKGDSYSAPSSPAGSLSSPSDPTTLPGQPTALPDRYNTGLTMEEGFERGSGYSMSYIQQFIKMILAGTAIALSAYAVYGGLSNFTQGRLSAIDLNVIAKRGLVVIGLLFIYLTL